MCARWPAWCARWRIGAISERTGPGPAEAAAYWHARRSTGPDERDEPEFERWRDADADHRAAYDRVTARHDDIRALADAPEILSLRHQTLARLTIKRRSDRRGRAGVGVMLAVALVATPFVVMRSGVFAPEPAAVMADAGGAAPQSFRTAVGQRLTLTLNDGSRVILNTASRLRVRYTKSERQLALDEGQAWFEVAKDKARPFLVHAGGQRVEAHGTAFDVRVMPGRTEVMLAEGKVTVDPERSGGAGVAMRPSDLLVASAKGTVVKRIADPNSWSNWRRGVVTFDNVPLASAIGEMNRYSETKLRLADAETGRIAVSGGFNAGATDAFVEALAIGFKVRSRKDAAGNIVLDRAR